jgi:hypothetical protein
MQLHGVSQIIGEDARMLMLHITRGVEQRDRALLQKICEMAERRGYEFFGPAEALD